MSIIRSGIHGSKEAQTKRSNEKENTYHQIRNNNHSNNKIKIENKLFTLILTGFVALSVTVVAQTSSVSQSSVQATLATNATKVSKVASTAKGTDIKVFKATVHTSDEGTATKAKSTRKSKAATTPAVAAKSEAICSEHQLATFVFVVNRGEVFAVNAPGELTELNLSGFTTDALPIADGGMMNENTCRNTVKLTGEVTINEYSPEPATNVIASLHLLPLTASRGLTLSLTIDGAPLRVLFLSTRAIAAGVEDTLTAMC